MFLRWTLRCAAAVLAVVLVWAPSVWAQGGGGGAAGGNRLQQIMASTKLRVCIWPDYYGISLRSPRTQQLAGVDADLALEFGKDLGVAVEFVDSSFARLVGDVTGNQCDAKRSVHRNQRVMPRVEAWIEEAPDDAAGIARALGDIARAKGMTQVARDAGFGLLVLDETHRELPIRMARPEAGGRLYVRYQATDPDGFVGPLSAVQTVALPLCVETGHGGCVQSATGPLTTR